LWSNITNVRLIYDGVQVGTTQTTVASNTAYAITLSFTAPVGATKTLEIKADIRSTAAAGTVIAANDTLTMTLAGGVGNAQRTNSLGSFAFPAADMAGSQLAVIAAALSANKNASIGDISAVFNQSNITIASYLITAGAAEGVDVSKFTFEDATTSTATAAGANNLGAAYTNLSLWYGTTQLGSTIVPSGAAAATFEFSPSPSLSLAAGQTVRVDLKTDVLSSPTWTNGNATKLTRVESTGKVTTNAANFTAEVAGQGLTLSGAGILSGAVDASNPETAIVAMGDTEKTVGVWKLTANAVEALTVSKIVVFNNYATSTANFTNLKLYCGSTLIGGAVEAFLPAVAAIGFTDPFAVFGGACVVPKGSNTLLTLKSDVTAFANGAQAGEYGQFYIRVPAAITGALADTITARGAGDYANTTASTSTVNRVYPYRSSLTAALACNGTCTGRTRSATDKIANLTLTAVTPDSAGAQLRAALNGEDNGTTSWTVVAADAGLITSTLATSATAVEVDGISISYQMAASSAAATTGWAVVNMGTALNAYSRFSFWIQQNLATPTEYFFGPTSTNAYANAHATGAIAALTNATWTNVDIAMPAGVLATSTYFGIVVKPAASTTAGAITTLIDAVKAYNDSITVNVSGNSTNSAGSIGTPVYLKTTGGTERAVGYFDFANSRAILVPSSEIAVGASGATLEMETDTQTVTGIIDIPATGISRTLSLSITLGTNTVAGNIRWYDQAVAATTPITWLNGASPISVTLSLATGN